MLGSYDSKLKQRNFKKDRIQYWLSKGVQLSPTIHNLLVDEKIIDKAKVKAWKPKKRESEPASVPVGATGEAKEAPIETPKTEEPVKESVVVDTETKKE